MNKDEFKTLRQYRMLRHTTFQGDYDSPEEVVAELEDANLVCSDLIGAPPLRRPVLDIDREGDLVLVPSSTPGHQHLYINAPMTQEQEGRLLDLFVEIGLVEEGFAAASKRRGYTSVRLPWVKK